MTSDRDWTGRVGDIWATEWRRTDRSFEGLAPVLNAAILAAAGPQTRTIVDIGCGAGATSLASAEALPDGQVIGIDLSPKLIAVANHRAGHLTNVAFHCADVAASVETHAPIDLYVSRHGVMFFADPVAAFGRLANAAAPGARIVFSCFAERSANRWAVETVASVDVAPEATGGTIAPGPFAFADPAYVAEMLKQAGWRATTPQRVEFAYRAGGGADPVADAVDYLSRIGPAASRIRDTHGAEREQALARLTSACVDRLAGDAVEFPAAAWIWTAHAARDSQGSLP
jgi:SAM-dependent methyltransferase